MATYAILDGSGNVTNVIDWDGVTAWKPPMGHTVQINDGTAQIGGTWNGTNFIPPIDTTQQQGV